MGSLDVAIIGGGIIGMSAAADLAAVGGRVGVFECDAVGAGASGRNQGILQRPFDPVLAELFPESLAAFAELSDLALGFTLPPEPAGILLVGTDEDAVAAAAAATAREDPSLGATYLDPAAARAAEPALAPGVAAVRLETGWVVPPGAATNALTELARSRGATIDVGEAWRPEVEGARVTGIRSGGRRVAAGRVLVAAGAWSAEVVASAVPAFRAPIRPLWGVIASVRLERPPRASLEELAVADIGSDALAEAVAARYPGPPSVFSITTLDGSSGVGATMLPDRPDEGAVATLLLERGAEYVPELASARVTATRACPRPLSGDGRPLLGEVPGVEGLYLAAGHGPWGVSTGPASGRRIAEVLSGRPSRVAPALDPARFA